MNRKELLFIDPTRDVAETDFPVIVFSENCRSIISWAIRIRTGGEKNHVMIMTGAGYVATQGFLGYKRLPIADFMRVGEKLKFVSIAECCTDAEKSAIKMAVEIDLARPWYRTAYDFLGIAGQLLGLKFINNPWKDYCSEIVAKYCKLVKSMAGQIPYKPNPEELNEALKKIPRTKLLGYWIND